jgi:hypothetical protein
MTATRGLASSGKNFQVDSPKKKTPSPWPFSYVLNNQRNISTPGMTSLKLPFSLSELVFSINQPLLGLF